MTIFWKFLNIAILILLVLLTIGVMIGKIAFGHGLGDLFYLGIVSISLFSHLTLTIVFTKRKLSTAVLSILFLAISAFILWKASLGRGSEYRWNGDFFYESAIRNMENSNTHSEQARSHNSYHQLAIQFFIADLCYKKVQ